MDIETAADLSNESQAKLANAKSRGLTCTLVMEAINSEKSWEEIKDSHRLKLCDANIHTCTSYFMDIQQKKKESLQLTFTDSKLKPSNGILQITLSLLGFL